MRIVYGVHGYGLGHATRAACILPHLVRRHEVLLLAGGDARAALSPVHPLCPIPSLEYVYRGTRVNPFDTLFRNAPDLLDAFLGGEARRQVEDRMDAFHPDLVLSDAEIFTSHAASSLRIPRVSFDHFGVLAHARPEAPRGHGADILGTTALYRLLLGRPDRAIVSSFFDAPVRRPGVAFVPTLLRPKVLAARPRRGDHLLVYFNRARHQFTGRLERELHRLKIPSIIYGAAREGSDGPLAYRKVDRDRFLDDLATCRAVLSTAGNQLVGEAMYLGKALLAVPDGSTEQQVNALAVERLGIGGRAPRGALDARSIGAFLERAEACGARARSLARDGTDLAIEAIERFAVELCGSASSRRRAA
jgi:uncharacterized protein (TIGR00661 family)